jgi:hypothetical protein
LVKSPELCVIATHQGLTLDLSQHGEGGG